MTGRPLTSGEETIVGAIAASAGWTLTLDVLRATELRDGGMGSLRFETATEHPRLGATLGEARFTDADGVAVTAVLTVDQHGDLFELDVWKVDFSPLLRWPEPDALETTADPGRA